MRGLEEDDAADLEQIPVVETSLQLLLRNITAHTFVEAVGARPLTEADEARVKFLVLPSRPEMHGGIIDLLHHT